LCRGFPQCTDVGERETWMCRGFPQGVQDVAVQRHLGSDLSPLGPTLAQLLLAIVSTYSCAEARPYPTLMRHVVVLSGSYPTYPCDGLLVRLAPRTQPIAVFPSLLAHPHALEPGCVSTLSPFPFCFPRPLKGGRQVCRDLPQCRRSRNTVTLPRLFVV